MQNFQKKTKESQTIDDRRVFVVGVIDLMGAVDEATEDTVTVRFHTRLSDPSLQAGDGIELSLPGTLGRKGLRSVLVKLLEGGDEHEQDTVLVEKVKTLEFLVGEGRERLRTTLGGFCRRRGLSLESVKVVEYFLPVGLPEEEGGVGVSESWVGCLDVVGVEGGWRVVTGDLEGGVEVVEGAGRVWKCGMGVGHGGCVKGVCWVDGKDLWVSASGDQTLGVWKWDERERCGRKIGEFSSDDVADGTGFECVANMSMNGSGNNLVAAGGFNGSVWTLDVSKVADKASTEDLGKRKASDVQNMVGRRLEMTRQDVCVSALSFRDDQLLSASWDGLVRVWDVERGTILRSIPGGGKALTDIAWSGKRLAASAVDGIIRLIDTDVKGEQGGGLAVFAKSGKLKSHNGLANAVVWLGTGDELASGGHDGAIRIWDARSMAAPVRVLDQVHGEDGKCLSLRSVADTRKTIISGGSDGNVKHFTFT